MTSLSRFQKNNFWKALKNYQVLVLNLGLELDNMTIITTWNIFVASPGTCWSRSSPGRFISPSRLGSCSWPCTCCRHIPGYKWWGCLIFAKMTPFSALSISISPKLSSRSKWRPYCMQVIFWCWSGWGGWFFTDISFFWCPRHFNVFDTIEERKKVSVDFYWSLWNIKGSVPGVLVIANTQIFGERLFIYWRNCCGIKLCNFSRFSIFQLNS